MTAPAHCVLDLAPGSVPRRPDDACNDFGGLLFVDSVSHRPNPDEELSAYDWKQVVMVLQRICRTAPLLQVDFTGGAATPTKDLVVVANNTLSGADVVVARVSAGVYTVTVPATSLPSANSKRPSVTVSSNGRAFAVQAGNVVTVTCYDATGTLSDAQKVNLSVYGGS